MGYNSILFFAVAERFFRKILDESMISALPFLKDKVLFLMC